MKQSIRALVLCALITAPALAFGDTITLRDGRVLRGESVRETQEYYAIKHAGAEVHFPRPQVISVARDSANPVPANAKQTRKDTAEALPSPGPNDDPVLLDRLERQLRGELRNPGPETNLSSTKTALARVLVRGATEYIDRMDYTGALKLLDEAWQLAPATPRLASEYLWILGRQGNKTECPLPILRAYLSDNPGDTEGIGILASRLMAKDPVAALEYLYPGNAPHPKASREMQDLLPKALLACFQAVPYPANAPFGKEECYQRLMAIRPDASPLPLLQYRAEASPTSATALWQLAECYRSEKNPWAAIPVLRQCLALQQNPEAASALAEECRDLEANALRTADLQMTRNQVKEAQATCEDAIRILGKSEKMRAILRRSIRVEPCPTCAAKGYLPCATCQGRGKGSVMREVVCSDPDLVPVAHAPRWSVPPQFRCDSGSLRVGDDTPGRESVYTAVYNKTEYRYEKTFRTPQGVYIVRIASLGNGRHSYQCRKCRGFVWADGPLLYCPHCEDESRVRTAKKAIPVPCAQCQGKGLGVACGRCGRKGLIPLAKPRATSVALDQGSNSDGRLASEWETKP